MERKALEQLVREIVGRMDGEAVPAAPAEKGTPCIPVEVSARHVHLSLEDLRQLFGVESLPEKHAISQPGQYLSEYRVRLIGPKGMLENVAVLGPVRGATQAEISATDARSLGVNAPVRLSGDLDGGALLCIQAGERLVQKPCGIIAKRHVHMTPQDAAAFGLGDGEEIALAVEGERPLTLEGVVVRVAKESALALHIDTDEANAAGAWGKNNVCRIARGQPIERPRAAEKREDAWEGKLLSEKDAVALAKSGIRTLRLRKGQLITPLALDALRAQGIQLVREEKG